MVSFGLNCVCYALIVFFNPNPDQIICFELLDNNGWGISLLSSFDWTITLE